MFTKPEQRSWIKIEVTRVRVHKNVFREILEHPPYSPDMSTCDYNLFPKVKEPLRGTLNNTRDELIRAIGRSIRNTKKDGRADGVLRLTNIWQKVINKGNYTEGT